jgi:hypothetical protein
MANSKPEVGKGQEPTQTCHDYRVMSQKRRISRRSCPILDSDLPATQSSLLRNSAGNFIEIGGPQWVRHMTSRSICRGYLRSLRQVLIVGSGVERRIMES